MHSSTVFWLTGVVSAVVRNVGRKGQTPTRLVVCNIGLLLGPHAIGALKPTIHALSHNSLFIRSGDCLVVV